MKQVVFVLLWVLVSMTVGGTRAYSEEEKKWSVGFLTGVYDPSLKTLNSVIANPNRAIIQDPNFLLPRNQQFLSPQRNVSSPSIGGNLNIGVEIERLITERHSLLFTLSVWNGQSRVNDMIPLILRSDQPAPLFFPREVRYNVVLNQFWLSWRYAFIQKPEVGRVFFNIGLAGFALANVTLDALVKVVCPPVTPPTPPCVPDGGFASVSSTEASGLGFSTHFGFGGQYFITKWLSIGAEINYVLGQINELTIDRIFPSGFEQFDDIPPESVFGTIAFPTPPPVPEVGSPLSFADVAVNTSRNNTEEIGARRAVSLELDGLNGILLLRLHF